MADYSWTTNEKAWITLGKPYAFTKKQYEYCKIRNAPIAIIYYDTKTSDISKKLYTSLFQNKNNIKNLQQKLSSYKIVNTNSDKFKGGYCCLFILDRCGQIQNKNEDQNYFINNILKQSDIDSNNRQFIMLFLSYNGKISCHQFPISTTIDQFSETLYEKCESEKNNVPKFSTWSKRQIWIDHQPKMPDIEIKPTKTGKDNLNSDFGSLDIPPYYHDIPAQKTYDKYDNDYSGEFKNIQHINSRPNTTYLLNLADISTPETTYYLQGSYDVNYPDNCVKSSNKILKPYINSDNIVSFWNKECITSSNFEKAFINGKKYRFFIFHENSHGNVRRITVGITYDKIWETFKDMRSYQRVWGLFDSCHDGSMIVTNGVEPKKFLFSNNIIDKSLVSNSNSIIENQSISENNSNNDDGILNYIESKLKRRAELFNYITHNQTTTENMQSTKNTSTAFDLRMILWSATGPNSYGWYIPGSNTIFLKAIDKTLNKDIYWNINNKKYTYIKIRYGWSESTDGSYWDDSTKVNNKYEGEQVFFKVMQNGTCDYRYRKEKKDFKNDPLIKLVCIPQCKIYPTNDSFETNIIFY